VSIAAAVILSVTLPASAERAGAVTAGPCQDLAIPETAATPNFDIPEGVAVDGSANIYATDLTTNTVYKFDAAGSQVLAIPPTAATPNLLGPAAVAVDQAGNVYTATLGRTVYRFDSTGTQTLAIPPTAGTPEVGFPRGVAVDLSGNIYVTDEFNDMLYRFDSCDDRRGCPWRDGIVGPLKR
jgi:DNA-binding beta-propeller fold protein YncE